MTIGDRIRFHRKKAGLTQKKLGELSETSETTIKQYESGKRQPRIEQLQKIAEVLKVPISRLLDVEDDGYSLHLHREEKKKQYGQAVINFKAFDDLLSAIGCELYFPENELMPTEWHYKGKVIKCIPETELNNLQNDIFSYTKFRLEELIKKYNTPTPQPHKNEQLNAAHANNYTDASEDLKAAEEKIMDDENF